MAKNWACTIAFHNDSFSDVVKQCKITSVLYSIWKQCQSFHSVLLADQLVLRTTFWLQIKYCLSRKEENARMQQQNWRGLTLSCLQHQWSRNEFESGAHFCRSPPLFGSTCTIGRFGERFRDSVYRVGQFLVCCSSTHGGPHVQVFVKVGARAPSFVPYAVGATKQHERL